MWMKPPNALAVWCFREKSNLMSDPFLEPVALPNTRWGPPWSLRKAHVRPTIGTAVNRRLKPTCSRVSDMSSSPDFSLSCPFPIQNYPQVLMAHGGGGKLMHQLISK